MAKTFKPSTHITVFVIVVIFVSLILLAKLNMKDFQNETSSLPIFAGENGLKTANYFSPYPDENDPQAPYLNSYQIKYPNNYFVTSSDSFWYFRSQGGGGFPNIVLTKNEQFTNPYQVESQAFEELQRSGQDCIMVYNFYPLNPDEEFVDEKNGPMISKESLEINGYPGFLITMKHKIREDEETMLNYYDLVLKLPEDVYYRFQTCTLNNLEDLKTVVNNFQVKGK